jgi:hypothetical protein
MKSFLTFTIVYLLAVLGLYLIGEITFPQDDTAYHPHECVRFTHGIWLPCRETLYPLKSGQPV